MSALASIPQEVLEHIAFFTATATFLGPPNGITALLSVDRRTHAALSMSSNPYLWSRIFSYKFDVSCPTWRLAERDRPPGPPEICEEFKLRCTLLKRIRRRTDCLATSYTLSPTHRDSLRSILWMAYLMMLENEGKNDQQLREYAGFDAWLKDFLFHQNGASLAAWSVKDDLWPPNDERSALALWLFWYMLKPGEFRILSLVLPRLQEALCQAAQKQHDSGVISVCQMSAQGRGLHMLHPRLVLTWLLE